MKSHRVATDYRSVECASGRRRDTARGGAHAEHTEERVAASSCVYCTRNNTRWGLLVVVWVPVLFILVWVVLVFFLMGKWQWLEHGRLLYSAGCHGRLHCQGG